MNKSSPEPKIPADIDAVRSYNAHMGLWLFAFYLIAYVGFVVLAATSPEIMGRPAWGGVNVAILYGFGLILGAFVVSIVYMLLCRTPRSTS
ncbi:hypothetical protein ETAA8_70570 [Anatilimnocola aggregata]|uniref:DUF485 domain-containing protein n=1 Tax=Anatilimnocola aggregata TaxID=2528021 RepID=A0A517YNU0_9BACT|nr:DUF485 domain-containing protein [Anatilimnocola aggregata]QDU31895.1 hypothetical protein ETAA8_70570 [Anatilimnocola aggregata]